MLYNIGLISVLYQHELVIGIHMSPHTLQPPSHFPSHSTPLGCHRASGLSSLGHSANPHWLSILHRVMYMFQCDSLNPSHLYFPHCVKFCSLCLCLHYHPANRFISTIFLDSMLLLLSRFSHVQLCVTP